jgi:peptide/nickel transport system permease protein
MLVILAHFWHRLAQVAGTAFLVAVLVFFLMHLLPGDPALAMLGDRATPASLASLRHEMGYDRSLATQFAIYIDHLLTLDLGESVTMRVPVVSLIAARLPITLMLTLMAALFAIAIALPLAFLAALREGGTIDLFVRLFSQLGLSMPTFYVGLVLLIGLAAGLHWFPVGGIGNGPIDDIRYMILPALTLAIGLAAILMRNLRAGLIEALAAEYVSFATAKGLPRALVLGRHVLRNALVSTVTLLGLQIGSLVGGAVITESVFAIPGIGRLMIDSIFARDYAVVQGLTVVIAVFVSVVFMAVDAVQLLLDPRAAEA